MAVSDLKPANINLTPDGKVNGPDGRRFLFLTRARRSEDSAIMLTSVDGSPPRELLRSATQAEYASGELLFVRQSVLMAQPFYAAFSASQAGRLVFHSGEKQAPVRVEVRDRKGALLAALPCASPTASWSEDADGI